MGRPHPNLPPVKGEGDCSGRPSRLARKRCMASYVAAAFGDAGEFARCGHALVEQHQALLAARASHGPPAPFRQQAHRLAGDLVLAELGVRGVHAEAGRLSLAGSPSARHGVQERQHDVDHDVAGARLAHVRGRGEPPGQQGRIAVASVGLEAARQPGVEVAFEDARRAQDTPDRVVGRTARGSGSSRRGTWARPGGRSVRILLTSSRWCRRLEPRQKPRRAY